MAGLSATLVDRFDRLHGGERVSDCDLVDILAEYYDRMKLDMFDDAHLGAVTVRRDDVNWIVVRIRLDGYEVSFGHRESFEIPPHRCWVKQGAAHGWV